MGFYLRKWMAEAEVKYPICGRWRVLAAQACRERADWLAKKINKSGFSDEEREALVLLVEIYEHTGLK